MVKKFILLLILSSAIFSCGFTEKPSKEVIQANKNFLENDAQGDMLGQILRFVEPADLGRCRRVNKYFKKIAESVLPNVSLEKMQKAFRSEEEIEEKVDEEFGCYSIFSGMLEDEKQEKWEIVKEELDVLRLYFWVENFGGYSARDPKDYITKKGCSDEVIAKAYILFLETGIECIQNKLRRHFIDALKRQEEKKIKEFFETIFHWSLENDFLESQNSFQKMFYILLESFWE